MKKQYIIGGLAIVGALALFAYLKPTTSKRNSDGFFGANGRANTNASTNGGSTSKVRLQCKRPNGSYYLMGEGYDHCAFKSDTSVGYINDRY